MNEPVLYNFSADAVGGTGEILYFPLPGDVDFLEAPNRVEVSVSATKTGTGGTPTLDVTVQSSPDNFSTAGLIHSVLAMTQLTDTGAETKAVPFSATVFMNRQLRLKVAVDTASGDVNFAGFVQVRFTRI